MTPSIVHVHNDPPPTAEVVAIVARVADQVGRLARLAMEDTRVDVRGLPRDVRRGEIPAMARRYYPLALRALTEGRPPRPQELRPLRERAAQRAQEGVPLSLLLYLWQAGFRRLFDECRQQARPDESAALGHIASVLFSLNELIVSSLVEAYQEELAVQAQEQSGGPPVLARLLLSGQDATAEAERLGMRIVERYDVMALALGAAPDEQHAPPPGGPPADVEVAARRKLRAALAALRRSGPAQALPLLDSAGGYILLPRPSDHPDSTAAPALVRAIQHATQAAVTAAVVEAVETAALSSGGSEAADTLRLVERLGFQPGLYRLADVALAYQLGHPGPAAEILRHIAARLEADPALAATLRGYLSCDLDRQRCARMMRVHRNTVNNRLKRVAQLTGFDPSTVTGITTLHAALTTALVSV